MRLKIVSDGTLCGTKVIDADSGAVIEGVSEISWTATSNGKLLALIHIDNPEIDIVADDPTIIYNNQDLLDVFGPLP